MKRILYICVIVCIWSCSKDVDSHDLLHAETEVVNGWTVKWQGSMTEEKRQMIRDLLNDMVLVEGGIFMMGNTQTYDSDARENESPAHLVKLTDYYICAHELSLSQIQKLMIVSSSNIYNKTTPYFSWDDWNYILNLISDYSGLTVTFPTEAQWEFAARGGNQSKGYQYPGSDDWTQIWSEAVDDSNTSAPNELGLYNMADKQAEWCLDAFAEYNNGVMETNPCAIWGRDHVVKGGCYTSSGTDKHWFDYDSYSHDDKRSCRSTTRSYGLSSKQFRIGCRPVINIK